MATWPTEEAAIAPMKPSRQPKPATPGNELWISGRDQEIKIRCLVWFMGKKKPSRRVYLEPKGNVRGKKKSPKSRPCERFVWVNNADDTAYLDPSSGELVVVPKNELLLVEADPSK